MAHEHHDRLDKKLSTLDFTAPECGSINLKTGKPEYCDFECPTLTAKQAPKADVAADPLPE